MKTKHASVCLRILDRQSRKCTGWGESCLWEGEFPCVFCPLQLVHGGLLEAVSQLLDSRCRDIGPTCVRGVHISRGELPTQPSTLEVFSLAEISTSFFQPKFCPQRLSVSWLSHEATLRFATLAVSRLQHLQGGFLFVFLPLIYSLILCHQAFASILWHYVPWLSY